MALRRVPERQRHQRDRSARALRLVQRRAARLELLAQRQAHQTDLVWRELWEPRQAELLELEWLGHQMDRSGRALSPVVRQPAELPASPDRQTDRPVEPPELPVRRTDQQAEWRVSLVRALLALALRLVRRMDLRRV